MKSVSIGGCGIVLTKQDITDFEVEAFLFYARQNLALGAGFGNAIAVRGGPGIKAELDRIGSLPMTSAAVTSAGNMKARHIVHAVGPAFQEQDAESKLAATLINALTCAREKGITQFALPAMGAGFYGIPLDRCAQIMVRTLLDYLRAGAKFREIILCANDWREYREFEKQLEAAVPQSARRETAAALQTH